MSDRFLSTRGRFDLDAVVGLVVRRTPVEVDQEAARRFIEGLELFRSVGLEFLPAWPEGQKPPRRRWRTNPTLRRS